MGFFLWLIRAFLTVTIASFYYFVDKNENFYGYVNELGFFIFLDPFGFLTMYFCPFFFVLLALHALFF